MYYKVIDQEEADRIVALLDEELGYPLPNGTTHYTYYRIDEATGECYIYLAESTKYSKLGVDITGDLLRDNFVDRYDEAMLIEDAIVDELLRREDVLI